MSYATVRVIQAVCVSACACACLRQCVLSSLLRLAAVNEIRVSVTCEEAFDEICSEREGGRRE